MFKIALCLAGLPRNIRHSYPSIKKWLLDLYDVDVYIHTWTPSSIQNNDENYDKDINFINNLDVTAISITDCPAATRYTQMYESIYNSIALVDENINYDIVIRMRMDTLMDSEIPYDELCNIKANKDIIYVAFNGHLNKIGENEPNLPPAIHRTMLDIHGRPYISDNFAFGSKSAMKLYANAYFNIKKVEKLISPVFPENILGFTLHNSVLSIKWSNFRYKQLKNIENNIAIYWSFYDNDYKFERIHL